MFFHGASDSFGGCGSLQGGSGTEGRRVFWAERALRVKASSQESLGHVCKREQCSLVGGLCGSCCCVTKDETGNLDWVPTVASKR